MTDLELGEGKNCFVVSPIGNRFAPVGSVERANYEQSITIWENVIEPACATFGLTAVRADRIADPGEIPDQIFTYLRDSDVVIADLSGANPNVMYELGLRHSRSAITLQIGEYERLPFDVTTIRTIQFRRTEAGLIEVRDQLIESLRAALTTGPTDLRATTAFTAPTGGIGGERLADDAQKSAEPQDEVVADEPGIVEVLAEGETAVVHVTEVLRATTEQIVGVGAIIQATSEEAQTPATTSKGFAGRLLLVRALAENLAEPTDSLEVSANEFAADVQSIDAMVRHIIARVRDGNEDTAEARTFLLQLLDLETAASEAAVGITNMRDGSRNLRKLSNSLTTVSKTLERGLGRFLEGIAVIQAWRPLIEALDD